MNHLHNDSTRLSSRTFTAVSTLGDLFTEDSRFVLVNIFSFVKRLFSAYPGIYNALVFVPALAVISSDIKRRDVFGALSMAALLLLVALVGGLLGVDGFLYFAPLLLIVLFRQVFYSFDFYRLLRRSIPLFIFACLYGLYQRIFGYTFVERQWIDAGLGAVTSENYFLTEDIRPLSVFAGVPEFAFFVVMYFFYGMSERRWWISLCALIALYLIGSRGMMLATAAATLCYLTYLKLQDAKLAIGLGLLVGGLSYFFVVYWFPEIFWELMQSPADQRLLVYGTFNARLVAAQYAWEAATPVGMLTGFYFDPPAGLALDNVYLELIVYGGFPALITVFYLIFLHSPTANDRARVCFFTVVFATYGLYAGMVNSYYLMFNMFVCLFGSGMPLAKAKTGVLGRHR